MIFVFFLVVGMFFWLMGNVLLLNVVWGVKLLNSLFYYDMLNL